MKNYTGSIPLEDTIKPHKMSQVNLDALIKREDLFKIEDSEKAKRPDLREIRLDADLKPSTLFFKTLRKPDFQRETSEWKPERIVGLIESFLNGDIIPSVILWYSNGNNFIIDGAHRLSAIISWVMDDYGDGQESLSFFAGNIPKGQLKIAKKTRELIKKEIGAFKDYEYAVNNQDKVSNPELLKKAKSLSILTLQVQYINTESPFAAEESFFKINGEATPINDTEALILKSRKKPNSIAARSILHAGTGHKYWSKFPISKMEKIESLANEINDLLFQPEYEDPIKTLDLPIAGKGYSAQTLEIIFNAVNLSNDYKILEWKKVKNDKEMEPLDDPDGDKTIECLKKTKRIISRIAGSDPYSLGLSPVVYFYSLQGRYQITSFMAIIELIKLFEQEPTKDYFLKFTKIRGEYERFLIKYKGIVNQVVITVGSGTKSYKRLFKLYLFLAESFMNGKNEVEIWESLILHPDFKFLKQEDLEKPNKRKEFQTETKSAINIKTRLANPILCPLCHGHIFNKSQNTNHINDKKNKGLGTEENGQITHYFCNSAKDKLLGS